MGNRLSKGTEMKIVPNNSLITNSIGKLKLRLQMMKSLNKMKMKVKLSKNWS